MRKDFWKGKMQNVRRKKSLHPKCAIFVKWQKVKVKKWLRGILEAGLRGSLNVPGRFRQRFARSTQWWPKFTISQVDSQKNVIAAKMYGISFFYGWDGKFNVSGQILQKRLARAKHCGEAGKFRILSLEGFERTWLQLGGSAVGGGWGGDFHKRRSCMKTWKQQRWENGVTLKPRQGTPRRVVSYQSYRKSGERYKR